MTAIIFGIILLVSGVGPNVEETGLANAGSIFGGISLVFGAIAYRLAKKRKLGVINFSISFLVIEVICIIIAIVIVAMTNTSFKVENPIAVLISGTVTIAYLRMITAK